jgi:hypothetical protein
MGSSDALDVISDYGDPSSAIANTWIEVMDGVVNHSLEVWFDRTGREPYAPLLVSRFLSDALSPVTELVEIRNQSPVTLDLSCYALGDEETVDAGEYVGSFPAGATLTAGSSASRRQERNTFPSGCWRPARPRESASTCGAGAPDAGRASSRASTDNEAGIFMGVG